MNAIKRLTNGIAVGLVTASASSAVWAAEHANDFDKLYANLLAWTTGTLGKSIALIFLLIGLGLGAVRGSIIGAVTCLAAALALVVAPDIVTSIFAGATTVPGG